MRSCIRKLIGKIISWKIGFTRSRKFFEYQTTAINYIYNAEIIKKKLVDLIIGRIIELPKNQLRSAIEDGTIDFIEINLN